MKSLPKSGSDYALEHGEGYQDWFYQAFREVQLCLSDDIAEQVSGIRTGDLVGLIDAIKPAVHQHEINNPHQVEIEYSRATMEVEGKNDVMTYISVLATFMRRLEAAGMEVPDAKAQRVLLNGVHQEIFESFIYEADRHPYASYRALVTDLKAASGSKLKSKTNYEWEMVSISEVLVQLAQETQSIGILLGWGF